jgi:hypothetical protein
MTASFLKLLGDNADEVFQDLLAVTPLESGWWASNPSAGASKNKYSPAHNEAQAVAWSSKAHGHLAFRLSLAGISATARAFSAS